MLRKHSFGNEGKDVKQQNFFTTNNKKYTVCGMNSRLFSVSSILYHIEKDCVCSFNFNSL